MNLFKAFSAYNSREAVIVHYQCKIIKWFIRYLLDKLLSPMSMLIFHGKGLRHDSNVLRLAKPGLLLVTRHSNRQMVANSCVSVLLAGSSAHVGKREVVSGRHFE